MQESVADARSAAGANITVVQYADSTAEGADVLPVANSHFLPGTSGGNGGKEREVLLRSARL